MDKTLIMDESSKTGTSLIDHYILVAFPQNSYIDHVSLENGKADDISKEILSVIPSTDSTESLEAVVCDRTLVPCYTGMNNGIIRRLEISLQKPLQLLVCLLHMNELFLKKYIASVDRRTMGLKSSTGEIFNQLNFDAKQLPLVDSPL